MSGDKPNLEALRAYAIEEVRNGQGRDRALAQGVLDLLAEVERLKRIVTHTGEALHYATDGHVKPLVGLAAERDAALAQVEALEGALREARPLVATGCRTSSFLPGAAQSWRELLDRIDALLSKGGGDGE